MHWFFQAVRYYPFWACPVLLIVFDLFVYYRRRKRKEQWTVFGVGVLLVVLLFVWILFRGDLHAERWIQGVKQVTH